MSVGVAGSESLMRRSRGMATAWSSPRHMAGEDSGDFGEVRANDVLATKHSHVVGGGEKDGDDGVVWCL